MICKNAKLIITMQGKNSFHSNVTVVQTGKARINFRSFESSVGDFKI